VAVKTHSPATPARLDPLDSPPEGRFCDLVLNGGVASGVVYPWALHELARHYRFHNIGGNSVGAMAAALAAAAEYGRCGGKEDAFEVLRQLPLNLAEEDESGRTRMLRLFQPTRSLRRPFDAFIAIIKLSEEHTPALHQMALALLRVYRVQPLVALALLSPYAALLAWLRPAACPWSVGQAWGAGLAAVLLGAALLVLQLFLDGRALRRNNWGLCLGKSQECGQEGLVEWLHRGVQLSAGRGEHDPPLTFADLWASPRCGRAGPAPRPGGLQPPDAGIDLQMFTSNITHARPVRLPLNDANTRLFFDPVAWADFFPEALVKALIANSQPYAPASSSDPPHPAAIDEVELAQVKRLRELPAGGMPIVVAARLSLSFPLLFSCVPVWAVDYEQQRDRRVLRRCLLTDGGLCSNFPVHLFDAAHPRWPTFALLLDRRLTPHKNDAVWLPIGESQGRGDNWQREVPGAEDPPSRGQKPHRAGIGGLLAGMLLTMKDWNDRVTGRLPHVRNRIVRLALRPGEGQLNIAMPGKRILGMARDYGPPAAFKLMDAYLPRNGGGVRPAWRQHMYVRAMIEFRALHGHLRRYTASARSAGDTEPLRQLLRSATVDGPLLDSDERAMPQSRLEPADAKALEGVIDAIEALEVQLAAAAAAIEKYMPQLEPDLRLRPPV
jgi:predicted acylesterase/phospholipase RssA